LCQKTHWGQDILGNGSVNREAVACYRLYAANCIELAESVDDRDRRVFLLNMARDWLKLADQAERNSGAGRLEQAHSTQPHPQSPDR
jgi:hypothetical protein